MSFKAQAVRAAAACAAVRSNRSRTIAVPTVPSVARHGVPGAVHPAQVLRCSVSTPERNLRADSPGNASVRAVFCLVGHARGQQIMAAAMPEHWVHLWRTWFGVSKHILERAIEAWVDGVREAFQPRLVDLQQ